MSVNLPEAMRAIAIDRFGGVEELRLKKLPLPEVEPDEVLIRVATAGVGSWDPFEREGGYAQMLGVEGRFPYVLGSEGAGEVAAVGSRVSDFSPGDRVYAAGFLNPKGGFYAEYVAIRAELVAMIPVGLTLEQAGALAGVGLTALRGLEDTLKLKAGESVLIFGASGGIGHVAVQLAKRMGARVVAVASGQDGVNLAKRLGADVAIDGRVNQARREGIESASLELASLEAASLDAAMLTASPDSDRILSSVRPGGRVVYPNGIQAVPQSSSGLQVNAYNGEPDADILRRLNRWIDAGPFEVHVAHTYPLEHAAQAHRALDTHHLGKLILRIR